MEMEMEVEGEVKKLVVVWATVMASLLGSHQMSRLMAPGVKRLCAFLPILCVFFYLPLILTSVHFTGTTSFFITWLSTFKLILLAFDKGPLYSSDPPLPISRFILTAALPIKIKTKSSSSSSSSSSHKPPNTIINYSLKFFVFLLLLKLYGHNLHPLLKMALFCLHIYVVLDLGLALVAYAVRTILGFDLEPHFNEPYLATSLQDFWGNRWNLMVKAILHPTVYIPVRSLSGRFLPKNLAPFPAVVASFVVSGLMHELIFYYIGRLKATWEVTWFFVIHGVLSGAEVVVKKAVGGRFRVPGVVSGAVTLSLVMGSSFWLFFPPFLRADTEVRSCKEFVAFMELVLRGRFVAPNHVSCPYF
ncbi:hypothetical protein R6Q57_027758 [Mikania cordata]